jgi:hypothetical protein
MKKIPNIDSGFEQSNRQPNQQKSAPASIAAKGRELRNAIDAGNQEAICIILERQDACEIAMSTDEHGMNALFYAIFSNDLRTINSLLSLPISRELAMRESKTGLIPLNVAAEKGSADAVRRLLELSSATDQVQASMATRKDQQGRPPC